MKQIPDRKKLRRQYLAKRGIAISVQTLFTLFMIPLVLYQVFMVLLTIIFISYIVGSPMRLLGMTVLHVILALLIWICFQVTKRAKKFSISSYVPPVKPDNLPAEEILVRGSEEPPVKPSDIILRAAREQEMVKEELLRASRDE